MATTDQEIYEALTGSRDLPKKGPCGCEGNSSVSSSQRGDLAAELESALDALASEGDDPAALDLTTLEGDELFADLGQDTPITLQDLVSLAEQYPGLKITISF